MKYFRILSKSIVMIFLIISFILFSSAWRLRTRDTIRRRKYHVITVSFFCELILKVLAIRVKVINLPPKEGSHLIVSNHMGVLDIIVLAAFYPTLFITSVDMREAPGLGLITEMGGCLYVERRNRSNIHSEIKEIREALLQRFNVTLYPEGTSTNGEKVLPFKKSLITSAAGTGIPIRPVVLNYRRVNGEPMSAKWRDHVCWYGDQTFMEAMMRTFTAKSIEAELEFCPEVYIDTEEQRREIAALLHQQVASRFQPII